MPTQVTNYQCPACTGPLHYSAKSGKLACDYCGSSFDVAEIEALIAKDKPDYTTAYNKAVALAEYMKNAPGDDSNDAY